MGLQKGGFKLKKSIRDNLMGNENIFMKYIYPMIKDNATNIEIINSDSAYGFVLLITVETSDFVNDDGDEVTD